MRIELNNVSKRYRKTVALDKVSLTLAEPKIYGLLGRNGAGKTTLMELLAGHELPTSGDITINELKPFNRREITGQICLIRENDNFHSDLKINQVIRIYEAFYPNWDGELAENLLEQFNLKVNKRIKALSKGMVSALGVIVGLASRAPITIFDEPYIGLDASSRQLFYDTLLSEYEAVQRTFILSTHLIDEASKLFEEIILMQKGQVKLHEKVDMLRTKAYSVTGEAQVINQYIKGKHVLKTKTFGPLKTAYIFGGKREQTADDISFNKISIQELMIYLSESEGKQHESAI